MLHGLKLRVRMKFIVEPQSGLVHVAAHLPDKSYVIRLSMYTLCAILCHYIVTITDDHGTPDNRLTTLATHLISAWVRLPESF